MDFSFANKTWDWGKVHSLVLGAVKPDSDSWDGWADVPGVSWFQLRCKAYDEGNVEAMLDVIQIERAVELISDPRKRAAVVLAMLGWDFADIGAAINAYKPGRTLVMEGLKEVVRNEQRRADMSSL